MMSKGSKQRPVDKKKFDDNWDKVFKKNRRNDNDFGVLHGKNECPK
jgi:hypothetical protein